VRAIRGKRALVAYIPFDKHVGVVFSRGVELEGLGTAVGVPAASGVGIKRLNAAT
jgi:hypothetical protein